MFIAVSTTWLLHLALLPAQFFLKLLLIQSDDNLLRRWINKPYIPEDQIIINTLLC